MPAIPQDQAYSVELDITEPLAESFVVIQTAVLYTTCSGMCLASFFVFD
jgi:protein transport protein SEC24